MTPRISDGFQEFRMSFCSPLTGFTKYPEVVPVFVGATQFNSILRSSCLKFSLYVRSCSLLRYAKLVHWWFIGDFPMGIPKQLSNYQRWKVCRKDSMHVCLVSLHWLMIINYIHLLFLFFFLRSNQDETLFQISHHDSFWWLKVMHYDHENAKTQDVRSNQQLSCKSKYFVQS